MASGRRYAPWHHEGTRLSGAYAPWHFLNFLPDPHQHGSLRPICSAASTRRCSTTGSDLLGLDRVAVGPDRAAPRAARRLGERAGLRGPDAARVRDLAGARRAAARP